ncbi:MAG: hypothetical protein U1F59_00920 [Candidatus Competibacteraceae bacterium]
MFEILAYIGNCPVLDFGADQGHAIDMIQRPRSTGSTLKPLLFADAIKQGLIAPDSLLADVPVNYSGFTPKNYGHCNGFSGIGHTSLPLFGTEWIL